jgi:hypothetical protein
MLSWFSEYLCSCTMQVELDGMFRQQTVKTPGVHFSAAIKCQIGYSNLYLYLSRSLAFYPSLICYFGSWTRVLLSVSVSASVACARAQTHTPNATHTGSHALPSRKLQVRAWRTSRF